MRHSHTLWADTLWSEQTLCILILYDGRSVCNCPTMKQFYSDRICLIFFLYIFLPAVVGSKVSCRTVMKRDLNLNVFGGSTRKLKHNCIQVGDMMLLCSLIRKLTCMWTGSSLQGELQQWGVRLKRRCVLVPNQQASLFLSNKLLNIKYEGTQWSVANTWNPLNVPGSDY